MVEHRSFGDVLAYSTCAFVASTVWFALACLLSTLFSDVTRPIVIACGVAAALAIVEPLFGGFARYSLFGIMDGDSYFHGDGLPWLGLLASAALAAAMLLAANRNLARQDF